MPTIHVRPRVLRRRLALVGLGGLLAAGIVGMPAARADGVDVYTAWKYPIICGWLSLHPQVSAVQPLFNAVQQDTGYSIEDTARVLVGAVWIYCPEHQDVLKAYGDLADKPAVGQVWRA